MIAQPNYYAPSIVREVKGEYAYRLTKNVSTGGTQYGVRPFKKLRHIICCGRRC